ncbi:hypothetical protein ACHQM5_003962 [Ranunculus cassubicifolius]
MSSWSCSKCTYLNPQSQSSCQICSFSSLSTTPPSPPSPSAPKWRCKACTFLNTVGLSNCDVCGTRASASLISDFEKLDSLGGNQELENEEIGSVFYPLRMKNQGKGGIFRESEGFGGLGKSILQPCSNRKNNQDFGSISGASDTDVSVMGKSIPCNKRKNQDSSTSTASSVDEMYADIRELGKFRAAKAMKKDEPLLDEITPKEGLSSLKILTYNVWFREDLELEKRMKSLGDLIQQHSPDVICFQEVTPNIYGIFRRSNWWKVYRCSVPAGNADLHPYFCMQLSKLPVKSSRCKPFGNSIMGRELCITEVDVKEGKTLVVATSHLESPCPAPPTWDQMFSKERVTQAKEAAAALNNSANVIFCGDMNWDDKLDGQFPVPDGWVDAWTLLRPREDGFTYDTKSNQMLSGNRKLQKRLDRFFCNLQDYKVNAIEMIGKEAIPGVTYCKEKKMKNEIRKLMLPVLPSDHYGLLLTICSK